MANLEVLHLANAAVLNVVSVDGWNDSCTFTVAQTSQTTTFCPYVITSQYAILQECIYGSRTPSSI